LPKVRPPTCLLADFITDRDPVTIIETSSKWPGLPHPPHLGFISFFRNIGLESKIFFLDLAVDAAFAASHIRRHSWTLPSPG
jgi:hypothetical protein